MITSASGWRKVFAASGDENDKSEKITEDDRILAAVAADVFSDYIAEKSSEPLLVLGMDTRPTGRALALSMLQLLIAKKISVKFPGVIAAPEIMAYGKTASGFIYISASHNPIGHNGIKFGLNDGGVLNGQENAKLVKALNEKCASESEITRIKSLLDSVSDSDLERVLSASAESKAESLKIYEDFSKEVISAGNSKIFSKIQTELSKDSKKSIGIIADMNGSARTLSIDSSLFESTGINFYALNNEPGKIEHAIIPEPENLVWCAGEMEKLRKEGHSDVCLGYMPDCDGDRGNIVFWNEKTSRAEVLKAQEVFALSVLSELSYMKYLGEKSKLAVAANCPTSMRIDEITAAFGAELFRAEVGEANVVNLARKKRDEGFAVRILGEGSNGGNITHPAAVRDPLNTIFALVKLLVLRDSESSKGLFHIWCDARNLPYNNDFTLADVLETLPEYTTTGVAEERAILKIKTTEHSLLKGNFQKIFEEEWNLKKSELAAKYGIESYEAIGTNGTEESRNLSDYSKNGKGGLKILFYDKNKNPLAYIWMRGSGTEPVFRVLCDVKGNNSVEEHELLDWERGIILKADEI